MTAPLAIEGYPNPIGGNGHSRHCGWEPTLRVVEMDPRQFGYQCPICGLRGQLGANAVEAGDGWEMLKPAKES